MRPSTSRKVLWWPVVSKRLDSTALEGFQGGISIGGRRISNLRYADDIVLLTESVIDLQRLINRLDEVGR